MPRKKISKTNGVRKFRFKKYDKIGGADAIEDKVFLRQCFLDNGELEILRDTINRPECIVLGRTGAGKTALLEMLGESVENIIKLSPDDLALAYLSNNTALRFYMELGVNMDLFFQVLWRHIFVIELIKARFDTTNEVKVQNLIRHLRNLVLPKKSDETARDYLIEWGESFWKETDYKVREFVEKLENDLTTETTNTLEVAIPQFGGNKFELGSHLAERLSTEQKSEIVHYGQRVVDKSQMHQMAKVIRLLGQFLDDSQKQYYITIDRLDERWVHHDDLRYRLIRALLDSVRIINHELPSVKIIVAIRKDLLERVFRHTRNTGDQEEKYRTLYLELLWNKENLEKGLDLRVDWLVKEQYTSTIVKAKDLLPKRVNKMEAIKYFIERTLYVPRDIILFFNECIKTSENNPIVTENNLLIAEGNYSENRLRALADEWSSDYPNLISLSKFLRSKNQSFKISDLDIDEFKDFMLRFWADANTDQDCTMYKLVEEKIDSSPQEVLKQLLKIFYKVGIVGIKKVNYMPTYWSFHGQSVTDAEISDDSRFQISRAFWRVLGIK